MPSLRVFTTAAADPHVLVQARALMDDAFGGGFSDADWEHALGGWHLVVDEGGVVAAHAAMVCRTLEIAGRPIAAGYVEAVATLPSRQGEGLGSLLMAEVGAIIRRDFSLGALSTGRHAFYERLGWQRWLGPTYLRDGSALVRTEDEDHGVMVLRVGPTADLDRSAPISCANRPGDAW